MHDPSSIALAVIVPENILTFTQKRDKELQSQLIGKVGQDSVLMTAFS